MKKKYLRLIQDNKFVLLTNLTERLFFFVTFLLAANNYPSEIYGQLITIFSLANIFVTILDLGLPFYVQREFSIGKQKASYVLTNALTVNIALLPLYMLAIFVVKYFFYSDISDNLFMVTVIMVYVFSLTNLLNKALAGLSEFRKQFIVLVYARLVSMILLIAAIYFLNASLWVVMLGVVLGSILQLAALRSALSEFSVQLLMSGVNFAKIKSILIKSSPLGLSVIFYFLYDKIDIIMISRLRGFDEVAFYSAGYGIYKSSTIIFSFIFTTGLTQISFLSRNRNAVKLFLKKYAAIVFWICILLSVFFFTCSDIIVKLLYPDSFSQSASVMKILAPAIPGMAFAGLTGMILNGLGMFKDNMFVTFIVLVVNVVLNMIFIPVYGIIGAAVVSLVSEYLFFAGYFYFIRKYLAGKVSRDE